jgi:hypothetical protein
MTVLSSNPTVRRREEALLVQARLEAIDAKLDRALGREADKPSSLFSDSDIEEVGKLLVEGRTIRLPPHARLTVVTTVEETKSKIFGNSQIITHSADQLHTKLLRPLTVLQALEAGLIRRTANGWAWSEAHYERLAANG